MKLSEQQVKAIRTMSGSSAEIAAEFGVSKSTIKGIRNGTRHSAIPGYVRPIMAPHVRGSAVGVSKLIEADVISIRESSKSNPELAELYGVTRQLIWQIRQGRVWAWLASHSSEPQPVCYGLESIGDLFSHYRRLASSDEAASTLVLAHVNEQREPPEDRMLSTEDVATFLNISTDLVYAMARDGRIRYVKLGKLVRFKRSWLDDVTTPKRIAGRHW